MQPITSIIVASYNAEKYLRQTLESVLAQTYPGWEMTIVDDGSKDQTRAIAAEYVARDPRIHFVCQENCGPAAARKRGFLEAGTASDSVVILDHDDVWKPNALETLRDALDAHPQAVGAHGLYEEIDADGDLRIAVAALRTIYKRCDASRGWLRRANWQEPTTFGMLLGWCVLTTPGLAIIRRDAMEASVRRNVFADGMVDWDLWLDVCRQGEMVFINEPLIFYRRHRENMSSTFNLTLLQHEARLRLWNSPNNSPEQRRLVRSSFRYIQWYYIAEKLDYSRSAIRAGNVVSGLKQLAFTHKHWRYMLQGHP